MNKYLEKYNYLPSGLLFVSLSSTLLLSLFDIEYSVIPLSISACIFVFFLLIKKSLSVYLSLLFIFLGTLIAVDIGFTFKATQFFTIFSLLNIIIIYLKKEQDYNRFKLLEFAPFILFIVTVLPSLANPHFYSEFYEKTDPVKIFFNYIFLQLICFSIAISVNTKNKLLNCLKYSLYSFLLVLGFGFFQQIAYYLGFYNPNLYVGFHSLIIDYYGPFLRFSPGTFSNEFGEITQSILIFFTVLLYNFRKKIPLFKKLGLQLILFLSLVALVLNFTRISWIVYVLFLFCFFGIGKNKLKERFFLSLFTVFIIAITYFLYSETDIPVIISIFDRFSELSELSSSSAGTRLEAWDISLNLFLERPFTGHGLGTASETHNVPIQLLAETGVQGLLGFYFLIFYLLHKFYKMIYKSSDLFLKSVSLAVFFSLAGCIIFDFTNHGIYHFVLWLIIALGLATEKIIKNESLTRDETDIS